MCAECALRACATTPPTHVPRLASDAPRLDDALRAPLPPATRPSRSQEQPRSRSDVDWHGGRHVRLRLAPPRARRGLRERPARPGGGCRARTQAAVIAPSRVPARGWPSERRHARTPLHPVTRPHIFVNTQRARQTRPHERQGGAARGAADRGLRHERACHALRLHSRSRRPAPAPAPSHERVHWRGGCRRCLPALF